ncbi:MAG: PhzF family phenazine biosynthesis isomerase [Micromonosporaceae bacterium]|nr:PhzF family phenazine biosynthesis isomerase [Micromonosporaceae bacterium]
MTSVPYEIVDVFTDRPFTGNPLAVVFDADGLATAQLQAIASEFNLSETVFVLPPTQPDATYRARIFTPAAELPFAGHPSVGAAVTVARRGLAAPAELAPPVEAGSAAGAAVVLVQECGVGLLPLTVRDGRATLTGSRPTVGPELPAEPLLAAVGLAGPDLAGPPPRSAGCGLEFPFLPVRPDALARATLDPAAVRDHGIGQVSVFAWDAGTAEAQARVFASGLGVVEDPATGSAALGLGVWLVASGLLPGDGESSYRVRQGAALGRPSQLDGTVTAEGGVAVSATVTGAVVPIASGQIAVPPG